MEIPFYQVDAFASEVFTGNPAGVCPLSSWLPDAVMQAIAAENNLSETAFFVPEPGGYHLRWFTPVTEIDLCGHATLGTAHVLFEELGHAGETIRFSTQSGPLFVTRRDGRLSMDFPAWDPAPRDIPEGLTLALGARPLELRANRDFLALLPTPADVLAVKPDLDLLATLEGVCIIVTAQGSIPGRSDDFVSRVFVPREGIPEDPVTGSAHCSLIPFWAARLGKTRLTAYQASARGGELFCELNGDRVTMAGRAALYLKGTLFL